MIYRQEDQEDGCLISLSAMLSVAAVKYAAHRKTSWFRIWQSFAPEFQSRTEVLGRVA